MVTSPPRSIPQSETLFYPSPQIALLQKLGVAVFPSPVGTKGTRVRGWPTVPAGAASRLLSKARTACNLAGRTGCGVAVIDLDAKNGSDPDLVLAEVGRKAGAAVIAIVRTRRGYHIWLRARSSVGNGFCAALGGDVFSDPHLAMLPPSIHPEGQAYEWVQEPREPTDIADLEELGFVPDEPDFYVGLQSKPAPAAPDVQVEFAALFAEKGVGRGRRVQDLVSCPFHDDREPSLSINWEAAVFHCFGEECLVGGGIGALRRLLGKNTPTSGLGRAPLVGKSGCSEDEVERLRGGLSALGHDDKASRIKECKARCAVGECNDCGIRPVFPLSCGQPFCPNCMPGRLASAWKAHKAVLPDSLTSVRLRPRDPWGLDRRALRKVRSRFSEWRERAGIKGGVYGIRLRWGHGAEVLLGIPAGEPVPQSSRAFEVEVVSERCSQEDFLHWLQDEYLDEARGWETDEDLAFLLEQTTRRRRFQGFGEFYESASKPLDGEADTPEERAEPVKLSRISGGSKAKAKKEVHLCPKCGGALKMLGFSVPREEVQEVNGVLQWLGAPPDRNGAAA